MHPTWTPQPLASPHADVDCWWAKLELEPGEVDRLVPQLSTQEQARAARFGTEALRARYVAGRAALRTVLAHELDIAPFDVQLARGRRGRPELCSPATLDFNVSHTAGCAVIALSRSLRIGVDVEHGGRAVNVPRLARRVLTAAECSALQALDPRSARLRFLRLWTCKEAMSKATADGLSAPMRAIDIDVNDDDLRLAAGPPPYLPAHWALGTISAPPEFIATLAVWHVR